MPGLTRAGDQHATYADDLQWRAGHVPGLTPVRTGGRIPVPFPFNGGPGTCPA